MRSYIVSVDNIAELRIVKAASAMYLDHCHCIATKAAKTANAVRRMFRTRALLWPAFQYYA